jgi:hypothetical protein
MCSYRVPKVVHGVIEIKCAKRIIPLTVNIYEKCRHAKSGTKSGTKLVVRFFLCPISAFCTRCPLGKEKKRTFTKSGGLLLDSFFTAFVSKYFVYYQCKKGTILDLMYLGPRRSTPNNLNERNKKPKLGTQGFLIGVKKKKRKGKVEQKSVYNSSPSVL